METNKDIIDFIQPRKREEIGDDYFNNLTTKIILENKKISKPKVIPFYKKTIFWISSVAALMIALLLIRVNEKSIVNEYDFNSVSKSELLAYMEENIDEFDTELMGEYLHVELFSEIQDSKGIDKKKEVLQEEKSLFEEVDNTDVFEYLENEELTIEDLEEL